MWILVLGLIATGLGAAIGLYQVIKDKGNSETIYVLSAFGFSYCFIMTLVFIIKYLVS